MYAACGHIFNLLGLILVLDPYKLNSGHIKPIGSYKLGLICFHVLLV
jgi:hypothetical protein